MHKHFSKTDILIFALIRQQRRYFDEGDIRKSELLVDRGSNKNRTVDNNKKYRFQMSSLQFKVYNRRKGKQNSFDFACVQIKASKRAGFYSDKRKEIVIQNGKDCVP